LSPKLCPAFLLISSSLLCAQSQDPGEQLNEWLGSKTGKTLAFRFESKQRAESRTGQLFGRDRDLAADYLRFRLGASWKPAAWLKLSGLMQDTRAPWYGAPAPGNVRDPHDLQEAYVEVYSEKKQGFGLTVGRQMLSFGDSRLIGAPQWAYTARTWDNLRLYHVSKRARLEGVFLSTIVPNGSGFNKPILGDRIWGTYSVFRNAFGSNKMIGNNTVDIYILRHDQNRPGGFTGEGTLGIGLFGTRWAIQLPHSFRFVGEGVLQNGHVGLLKHRAAGGVAQIARRTNVRGLPLELAHEYKYASGTNPNSGHSGTFDQLYPAAHDKLGHADLMAWKNVHNIRSTATLNVTKTWNFVLMYNNTWLADPRDAVYNLGSRPIARDPSGKSGRHVGNEIDLYTNYQKGSLAIAAGIGQFFPGQFINNTTPGAHSRLIYLSTGFSF
jgi:hypothetical protein